MAGPLGGGKLQRILVIVGAKREHHTVIARIGLWGVAGLGVVTEGEFAGSLLVYNRDVESGWQLVTSVFHAFRQTFHILHGYGKDMGYGEKGKMARAAQLARELNLAVLGLGLRRANIATLRSQTRGAITAASRQIGTPRRLTKQQALTHLSALAKVTDRLGRANPGAMRARTVETREALLLRIDREILRIDPRIFQRQRTFINLIQYAEMIILFGVRDFLETVLTDVGLAQLQNPVYRLVTRQHCQYLAADLERLDFAPYRESCVQTALDVRSTAEILSNSLDDGGTQEVRALFAKCQNAMALKAVQLEIERLLYILMRDGKRPSFDPRAFSASIQNILLELAAVDETGFRLPVRDFAAECLSCALEHIDSPVRLKDELKNASSVL
ncbi:MAG: hypothetical protein V1778_01210 [bacterium]